jgi:hypothetical protein
MITTQILLWFTRNDNSILVNPNITAQIGARGCGPQGDRSTVVRQPFPHVGAHRSSTSGRSGARELRPRGGGGEGRDDELNSGVTTGREAVEGHLPGGIRFGNRGDSGGAQEQGKSEGEDTGAV